MSSTRPLCLLVSFFCLAGFLACFPETTLAAMSPLQMETEDERLVRWDLSADSLISLNDSEVLEAVGNVYLVRGNEYMKADFARYYASTKWVYLQGNVIVKTGKDEITAEEAEFDLRSRVGWMKNGRIFMDGPHTYISGSHITKHWGDVYSFKQAKVTACDGDNPAWSLTADEAVVEIDGYARLTRSTFQVKDMPVGFSPYFIVPVKTTRQTGLLAPNFGTNSQKGLYYSQSFFWAIDESNDMTFSETYFSKRGFLHGVELRSHPTDDQYGWLRFDWMYDRRTDSDGNSLGVKNDGLVRENQDRYWLRGMYDGLLLDSAWRLKADVDYVSDQDFLTEFKNFSGGFNYSRDELFKIFNRDLQEKNRERKSGILLTRDWERGAVAFSSFYTQNIGLGNGNAARNTDDTVQQLPRFDAFLYKGRVVPSLPLEVEGNAMGAYMYRRSGTKGAKYQVSPTLTLPLTSQYGSIIASAGVTQSLYDTESAPRDSSSRTRETSETRTVFDFNVAAATEFDRVYSLERTSFTPTVENLGSSQITAMRHSIQPRLEFSRRPTERQEDNPYYEADDRLTPRTQLVYSLTNVLSLKRQGVVMGEAVDDEHEPEPELRDFYQEFARLRLQQAYDFREADRTVSRDRYGRRPYGDVLADLTVNVTNTISLTTRNDWSPYVNDFTRHYSWIRYYFEDYGSLRLGYDRRAKIDEYSRYRGRKISYLTLGGELHSLGPFSLDFEYKYDIEDTQNREAEVFLTYNHQCFQIVGSAFIEPDERSYQIMFVFNGLGDW